MKMKKLLEIRVVLVTGGMLLVGNVSALVAAEKISVIESHKQPEFQSHKLTSPAMGLLNKLFEITPISILRVQKTFCIAAKVLGEIRTLKKNSDKTDPRAAAIFATPAAELLFVQKNLKLILDPVLRFFEDVREHTAVVKPIVVESLMFSSRDLKKSLLIKFFDTKDEPEVFFKRELVELNGLETACVEFITVFNDINASLSDAALVAYKKKMELLQKQQEAAKKASESVKK